MLPEELMSSYECIVVMNRRGECEHVHYSYILWSWVYMFSLTTLFTFNIFSNVILITVFLFLYNAV